MEAVSWIVIVLLILISIRRFVLLLGAMLTPRPANAATTARTADAPGPPSVLVVVPARDEELKLGPLLGSLDALEYPAEQLSFVLVSDASSDGTDTLFCRWCRDRPRARTIRLETHVGKPSAINAALKAAPETALVAIYDADQKPRPDSLRKLAHAFNDPRVGAASGYRQPFHPDLGIVSRYAALETWVHQLIVQAGKDRWSWNPPTMGGNCLYRVSAIAGAGGFPDASYSEDVEISLALIARGWRTRFLGDAVADSRIGESLHQYAAQRVRWSYGMYGALRKARSLEALMVSSGYADRLAFAAGCVLVLSGRMSAGWLAVYLSAPFLEALTALTKTGRFLSAPIYFLSAVPMFLFDIGIAAYATAITIAQRRPRWS